MRWKRFCMRHEEGTDMNYREFAQSIKQQTVHGVYLFEGVEENIKNSALTALRKAILPEGMEELNEAVITPVHQTL